MSAKKFDPLQFIPSPDIVRKKLTETLDLADRLKVLLEVSERIQSPARVASPEPFILPPVPTAY